MLGLSVYSYEIHTYVRMYMHTYVAVASRNRILVELDSFEIFTLFYSYAYVDYFLQVWYLFVLLLQSYKRTVRICMFIRRCRICNGTHPSISNRNEVDEAIFSKLTLA